MIHSFDTDHAKAFGVEAAIILYNIDYWIKKNKANSKHCYEGSYWTYNSVSAWAELFPYLTKDVIRKRLDVLVEKGVLKKGYFNQDKRDRTSWYSIDFSKLQLAMEPNAVVSEPKSSLYTDSKHSDVNSSEANASDELFPDSVKQKPPKVKSDTDPCYKPFVDNFNKTFPNLLNFPRDGKHIKSIIRQTKEWLTAKQEMFDDDRLCGMWLYALVWAKSQGHFCAGKDLGVWDQKIKSVYNEITEGKFTQRKFTGTNSADRFSKYAGWS